MSNEAQESVERLRASLTELALGGNHPTQVVVPRTDLAAVLDVLDAALKAADAAFDAVVWMSGSPSFGPGGEAADHWPEVRERVFAARAALSSQDTPRWVGLAT